MLAEDGANDPLNYPVTYVNVQIWVNNHAHVLQGKDDILDNRFLAFAFSQLRLGSLLVGGSRPKLNSGTLVNLELRFPTIEEQKIIGSFCADLDRLISLQEQKLEKLQSFKKAMLIKMFPQKGSRVLEIRFRGFAEPWEERMLGEIASKVAEKNVGLQYLRHLQTRQNMELSANVIFLITLSQKSLV